MNSLHENKPKSKFKKLDLQRVIKATSAVKHNNGTETYWMGRCLIHDDKDPSCKIWGEPHDAKVHCFAGCDWKAIRDALLACGCAAFDADGLDDTPAREYKKPTPEDDWEHVSPVPDSAPPPLSKFKNYPPPTTGWEYLNEKRQLVGYVFRFDLGDGKKDVVPQTLWKNKATGALVWRWKAHPEPRPLYHLNRIAAHPDRPVVVTEGEKAADAAGKLFPDRVIITSPGGCLAAGKADWTPLKGRDVVIWPDADQAGLKYRDTVARLVHAAGAASVKVLPVLDGKPEGWDAADALAEGWTPVQAAEYLAQAQPWTPAAVTAPTDAAADDDEADFTPAPDPWPAPLAEEAFHGLAGEFVRTVNPHSESDPAADLVQFLACFGNAIGRGPHWTVSATEHHLNLFINLVGKTARGRKGTSLDVVLKVFGQVDEVWRRDCVTGGLSSGEGLKYAVRDPVIKNGEIVDHGVVDKRLLVVESEFANVLKVLNREGNTLSPTVRQAWESGTIKNLTKHDSITATGAHISIVGHITQDELLKRLAETESSNGFTNRFLWFAVRRSKSLPRGGNLDESALNSLVIRLHGVLEAARNVGEMGMTENAWTIWDEIYEDLSRGIPGLLGLVTARAEAQVRRLACLYALLDQSDIVDVPHLKAALAVWRYAEDSARYIFGDATGNPVADTIMSHLRQSPDGLTRKQIREEIFQRNKSSREIGVALNMLEEAGMARKERIQTGGRPAERWYALTP